LIERNDAIIGLDDRVLPSTYSDCSGQTHGCVSDVANPVPLNIFQTHAAAL
jgi:hypothetical protein